MEKKPERKKGVRQGAIIKTASGLKLTPSQEAFAKAYTAFGEATFCKATDSLLATRYFTGKKQSAYAYAGQMRRNPVVAARIRELLEDAGFGDDDIDLEHLKVIKQDKDLTNKMKGIIEYNRLKGRGAQQGMQVSVNIINFSDVLKQRNHDSVSVQSGDEAVSVGDSGE